MTESNKRFVWGVRVVNDKGEWKTDRWDYFDSAMIAKDIARERGEKSITRFLISAQETEII